MQMTKNTPQIYKKPNASGAQYKIHHHYYKELFSVKDPKVKFPGLTWTKPILQDITFHCLETLKRLEYSGHLTH
jgi:hypothetical protein